MSEQRADEGFTVDLADLHGPLCAVWLREEQCDCGLDAAVRDVEARTLRVAWRHIMAARDVDDDGPEVTQGMVNAAALVSLLGVMQATGDTMWDDAVAEHGPITVSPSSPIPGTPGEHEEGV